LQIAQNFTADAGSRLKQVCERREARQRQSETAGTIAVGAGRLDAVRRRFWTAAYPAYRPLRKRSLGNAICCWRCAAWPKDLAAVPGRKILVLFTEGFPAEHGDPVRGDRATIRATKRNVVDSIRSTVRGLVGAAPGDRSRSRALGRAGRRMPIWLFWNPAAPRGGILAALGLGSGFGMLQPAGLFPTRWVGTHGWHGQFAGWFRVVRGLAADSEPGSDPVDPSEAQVQAWTD